MAIDRERAKAAGYTDAEIDAYEAEQAAKAQGPVAPEGTEPPPPPPPDPNQGQAAGSTLSDFGATLAVGAPDIVGDVAKYGIGAYGAYKVGKYLTSKGDLARSQAELAKARAELARSQIPTPEKTFNTLKTPEAQLNQPRGPMGPSGAPTAPTAPTAPAPAAAPAATPPAQPAASQGNMAQRVAQIAYDKISGVAQRAAPYARAGMGALAALTPGNIGQDYPFPMSGPQRGQEINPATGRPWTREELSAYYASQR